MSRTLMAMMGVMLSTALAVGQSDVVADGPTLVRQLDERGGRVNFFLHGVDLGQQVALIPQLGFPAANDPSPTALELAQVSRLFRVDRLPFKFSEDLATFGLGDVPRGEVFTVRALVFGDSSEPIPSNPVILKGTPKLFLMIETAGGSSEVDHLTRFDPHLGTLQRIEAPGLTSASTPFALAGADEAVFYSTQTNPPILRSVGSLATAGRDFPLLQDERVVDIVVSSNPYILLVLTAGAQTGGTLVFRLRGFDVTQARWWGPQVLSEPDQFDPDAYLVANQSEPFALFGSRSPKILQYKVQYGLSRGAWILPSPNRYDEVVSVAAVGPHVVAIMRREDGLAGWISVTNFRNRDRFVDQMLHRAPRALEVFEHDGILTVLVLFEGGKIDVFHFDPEGYRPPLLPSASFAVPGATELVLAKNGQSAFALTQDGRGAQVWRLDLVLGTHGPLPGVVGSAGSHHLGVMGDSAEWLFLVDPAGVSSDLLVWDLDTETGKPLSPQPGRFDLGGEVRRLVVGSQ